MSTKRNTFKPTGEFAQHFIEFCLQKAREAKEEGVSPLNGDYSWETYKEKNEVQVAKVAAAHPPPAKNSTDTTLRVRENHKKAVNKFISWLRTGGGFPSAFSKRCGLIESGFGGSCADEPVQPGSDEPEPVDEPEQEDEPSSCR